MVYPKKITGKERILYNDSVEEALCFGWIDSTVKGIDENHSAQRFTPRKPKSAFSQANKKRLQWLMDQKMIHSSISKTVKNVLQQKFLFP